MEKTQLVGLILLIVWSSSGIIATYYNAKKLDQLKYIKNIFSPLNIALICLFGPFIFLNK